jgi:biotin carboxylase
METPGSRAHSTMDRVILLDTNVASAPIHRYLADSGYEVYVVGRNPSDYLAKAVPNYVNLDYSDVEATLALVDRLGAKYLVPGCNDLSYAACAAISARRPFPGIDPVEVVRTLGNKQDFRRYAALHDIPAPRLIAEADAVAGRSVIVKPVDAYSGRGVTALKAPTRGEIHAALALAKTFSAAGAALVEELVEGQLYSHTAFLSADGVVADFIVEEHGSINPFTVDTSCLVADFDPPLLRKVRATIERIARDLKLASGLIHTQFISDGDQFWIIEITRRCPGDLYSLLISLSTGFDYAENYARPFLDRPFKDSARRRTAIMRHTIALRQAQTFGSLQFHRPIEVETFFPQALAGDRVAAAPFARIGILFARTEPGAALDELMAATVRGELYSVLG